LHGFSRCTFLRVVIIRAGCRKWYEIKSKPDLSVVWKKIPQGQVIGRVFWNAIFLWQVLSALKYRIGFNVLNSFLSLSFSWWSVLPRLCAVFSDSDLLGFELVFQEANAHWKVWFRWC
jgi:hypothetical protein